MLLKENISLRRHQYHYPSVKTCMTNTIFNSQTELELKPCTHCVPVKTVLILSIFLTTKIGNHDIQSKHQTCVITNTQTGCQHKNL